MWFDKLDKFTKGVIQFTRLCASGRFPSLKTVRNDILTNAIGSKLDKQAMNIDDIWFASMVIGYKNYYSS